MPIINLPKSRMLKGGVRRAIHVFTPMLMTRLKDGGNDPVMAIRSYIHNYEKMLLVKKVEILGPSEMVELFDKPLPGTGGRGVAILFTSAPIKIWFDRKLYLYETKNKTPDQVAEQIRIWAKKAA